MIALDQRDVQADEGSRDEHDRSNSETVGPSVRLIGYGLEQIEVPR